MTRNRGGFSRRALAGLLLLLAAACVPIRQEAGWPALGAHSDGASVFLAYNDRITLLDARDGLPLRLRNADGEVRVDDEGRARVWEFSGPEAAPNQFFAAPAQLDESNLLVLSNAERLFEVNLARADALVSEGYELGGRALAPPLTGEELLWFGAERTLFALRRGSYEEVWRHETGQGIWSQPLLLEGTLYVTSLDHHLYALEPATGALRWRLDLGGAAPASPVAHEGRLYVGSFARKIYEIETDGRITAEFGTADWVWGRPTVVDGVLYASDLSGAVYALEIRENGFRELWRAQASEAPVRAAPAVSGEYVIVATRDNQLVWLARESGRQWFTRTVAGEVVSDMLLLEPPGLEEGPLLLVATLASEEALVAFDASNGERIWSYRR